MDLRESGCSEDFFAPVFWAFACVRGFIVREWRRMRARADHWRKPRWMDCAMKPAECARMSGDAYTRLAERERSFDHRNPLVREAASGAMAPAASQNFPKL